MAERVSILEMLYQEARPMTPNRIENSPHLQNSETYHPEPPRRHKKVERKLPIGSVAQ